MLFGRDESDGLNIRRKALVRQRHAELELKIRKYAQTTHNDMRVDLVRKINGQTAITFDLDLGVILEGFLHERYTFFRGEHQTLQWLVIHGHNHFIKETRCARCNVTV